MISSRSQLGFHNQAEMPYSEINNLKKRRKGQRGQRKEVVYRTQATDGK
jgi:hypothetical protein